jgi:hypothetical protein
MKKVKTHYEKVTAPIAYITKDKQRIKQYNNDTVFLEDGDEFEIELFNPTKEKILAKISINGKFMDSGIVLRPGERVFLERYMDESKKFIFETYDVDGDDPNTQKAIENNGEIRVQFFNEFRYSNYGTITWTYYDTHTYPHHDNTGGTFYYTDGNSLTNSSGNVNVNYTNTEYDNMNFCAPGMSDEGSMPIVNESKIETGRVEKGSHSDQSFVNDSTCFDPFYSWKRVWKILPKSRKAIVKEDLVVYCTNCGAKRKKDSFKFCPHCGAKF